MRRHPPPDGGTPAPHRRKPSPRHGGQEPRVDLPRPSGPGLYCGDAATSTTTPAGPPELSWWTFDAILADGGTIRIRPITPADGTELVAFHDRLSKETVYLRFFSAHPYLRPDEVERFTHVDYRDRMALVATLRGSIVAVARYDRTGAPAGEAEVAFVVDDSHQGRGLGTLLLEHLAAYAKTQGIGTFVADTLPQNRRMLDVFRQAGFARTAHLDSDVVRVTMDITSTEATRQAIESRSRQAAARSIERLLRPQSVAVIGAGRTPGTIGHDIFRNLLAGGFTGPVYPVHPSARSVAGVRAYPRVQDIPDDVDLAVIVLAAEKVPAVVEECAAKEIKGLILISAGFAESNAARAATEEELVAAARGAGMRLIGPNCMGVINTAPDISLNATFAPDAPRRGRVAFASQSGGLGTAVLAEAARRDLGLSSFVSMGNKADVSSNDLLLYWQSEPETDVVLLYLESFGNPRRFARIAREVSRSKPIVAVKAGRAITRPGSARSHTATLAVPEVAVDALFTQAGVIRVDTLEEMFRVTQILAHQPLPSGNRVAIIGNSGGPCVLAADACEGAQLEVAELSLRTRKDLGTFLPPEAAAHNPVNLGAWASPDDFERAIASVLEDQLVDAVVVVFTPPLLTDPDRVARAIASSADDADKPVLASFLGVVGIPELLRGPTRSVPSFSFPEGAVHALGSVARYARWRERPTGHTPALDVEPIVGADVVRKALAAASGGTWLSPPDSAQLLEAYGIPIASSRFTGAEGAPQRAAGVETIVGVVQDPSFGPLVMFGSGGSALELFADRSFRILPMTDLDARDLIRSVRGSALLFGYRGSPPCDVDALEQIVLRVARMADDLPEIVEMDLDPVVVSPDGAVVLDARVRVSPAEPGPDPSLRRLR